MKVVSLLKNLFTAILLLNIVIPVYAGESTAAIPVKTAAARAIIDLKIKGTYNPETAQTRDNMYYGKCMEVTLKSKVDSVVRIKLECGRLLVPVNDHDVQTMIMTEDVEFYLPPKQSYKTAIYAMCTEIENFAPSVDITFEVGKMAKKQLVCLAKYLEENNLQNMTGQHAVWAYTDNADFDKLEGYGADSISIENTKKILNTVGIETPLNLNEIAQNNEETDTIPAIEPENSQTKTNAETETTYAINEYYILGGAVLAILLISIIVLVRKKKK